MLTRAVCFSDLAAGPGPYQHEADLFAAGVVCERCSRIEPGRMKPNGIDWLCVDCHRTLTEGTP